MLHFGQWKFAPCIRLPHASHSLVKQQLGIGGLFWLCIQGIKGE